MKKPRKPLDPIGLISRWTRIILMIAAFLTLAGLGLMVWSLAEPTPMPVILAMSVGQGLGIFAFALYGVVVLVDQLRNQREAGLRAAAASNGVVQDPAGAVPLPGDPVAPSREASP